MYNIAICDDDIDFEENIKQQISKILSNKQIQYTLHTFHDATDLLNAMKKDATFDLIFLDIMIREYNGIDIARFIRNEKIKSDIIFITSSSDYAVDGYSVFPLHYLTKPVESQALETAINRFIEKNIPSRAYIKTASGLLAVPPSHIIYFESLGHKLFIHYIDGKVEQITASLRDLESELTALDFCRVHKSYFVNMHYIKKIARYTVTLTCNNEIPIGKARYNDFQRQFIDYTARKIYAV